MGIIVTLCVVTTLVYNCAIIGSNNIGLQLLYYM